MMKWLGLAFALCLSSAQAQVGLPFPMVQPLTASYTAQGIFFSNAANNLRGGALTGVSDSKVGTLSFWWKSETGSDGSNVVLNASYPNLGIQIARLSSNTMRILCQNAAGSNVLIMSTVGTFTVAAGWKHVLASWNLATGTSQIYVEDVSDVSVSVNTNDTIAYASTVSDWLFPDNGNPANNDIADFYFDPTTFTDLTVTANRRKFISAGLAPVNLGTSGQIPTGSTPALFFSGAVSGWITNKGTGGGFTVHGQATTAAGSNPP